jgi:pimeloyl-ACP methyl ester carboxylesterase
LLASLGLLGTATAGGGGGGGGGGEGGGGEVEAGSSQPPLVLVGVQYGAVIARQFALLHPHLSAGLLLLETSGVTALAGDPTRQQQQQQGAEAEGEGVGWEALVQRGGVGTKNGIFEPFIYKNEHFAKTGSGQT